jgi:hypothetical protein
VTYRARVVGRIRIMRAVTGDETTSTVAVYLSAAPLITVDDRLTLPEGWVPPQPPIIAVRRVSDDARLHHQVLYA